MKIFAPLLLALSLAAPAAIPSLAQTAPSTATVTYSPVPRANALYLKARDYLAKSDPRTGGSFANGREAVALYRQAVKADPKFARAYVDRARAYLTLSYSDSGAASDAETTPAVREALRKAVEADPNLPDAHQLTAAVAYNLDFDWAKAEREYRRTLELAPENAAARVSYAGYLGTMGRFDEALDQARQADALAPSANCDFTFGRIYYSMHKYDEAVDYFTKSLARQDNLATRFYLGLAYLAQNRFDKAMPTLEATTLEKNGGAEGGLAYARALQGDKAGALEILDKLFANRDSGIVVAYRVAAVYLALGDRAQAISWLNIAYAHNENWVAQLKVDPVMDPLRSDPGFIDLMHRLKFA
jgi:tetratricopeptide (TPR) repeat protein